MAVPFHSPVRAYEAQRAEIDGAVSRVLSGGRYVLGPEVDAFEVAFAEYTGVGHAVGVASGTDALVLAIKAAGLMPGDEVITAANAGGYTTTACVLAGVSPVFADVRESDLTLNPASAAKAVSARTKAVVATHLYGSLADVHALRALADRHGLVFIEDCAQSHGATLDGRLAGSFGDLATFSFYPTKNLGALGDGGAVVCRDDALAKRLRSLRQYGWASKYEVTVAGGMNSRLDPVQAAVLGVRLPRLDERNARRRALFERYERALSPAGLRFGRAVGEAFVGHLCVVRVAGRDALRVALDIKGVGTDIHYPILDCDQPAWRGLGWRAESLEVSRGAAGSLLSLPLYPEMTDAEADEVVRAVLACMETIGRSESLRTSGVGR
jgi:dTDP-4-amino-4,6-dideoxygalactose transaminase